MTQRALTSVLLVILLVLLWFPQTTQHTTAVDDPQVGFSIISPVDGPWEWQLEQIRLLRPEVVKVIIPHGFRTRPVDVEDILKTPSVGTIIMRTQDCNASYDELRESFVNRGYLELVDRYPEIDWWLEIGNEPEYCTDDLPGFYQSALENTARLKAEADRDNLSWMLSLPVTRSYAQTLIGNSHVEEVFDGYGTHIYAHQQFGDGGGTEWDGILSDLLSGATNLPVWITEAGIDDPVISDTTKAERYTAWLRTLDPQIAGVTFFVIAGNDRFPNYTLSPQAHNIIGNRDRTCWFFPETGYQLCDQFLRYWQENGGVPVFGYPLTTERLNENELVEQVTERSVFELHQLPERVLLRRLGAEYLE